MRKRFHYKLQVLGDDGGDGFSEKEEKVDTPRVPGSAEKEEMKENQPEKTVRTFALASFFNDMGSDIIYPVWPLFVTSVLGANMAVLGFLDGLGEALVSVSQAASGYVSDRIRKRKVFVWAGYLMGASSRIGYAFSAVWTHLVPFRILDRAGKIRSAPRDAIIADLSTRENRGRHFGLVRMMDHLGAVSGILLCILLFEKIGYRNLFLLAAAPSLVGAGLIFFLIREQKFPDTKIYKGLSFRDLDRNFMLFLILNAVFALGAFSYSFLLIFAGKLHLKTGMIPVLYLIFTLTAALFSLPFGRLADRIGRKPVMLLSFLFWGLVCLGVLILRSSLFVALIFVFQGLHRAALEPVQKTLVAELAPAAYRASSLGGFQMVTGLCAFPASFLAGIFWDRIGIAAPFILSLSLTAVSAFLLLFVREPGTGGEIGS